jgi:hypothetical protein
MPTLRRRALVSLAAAMTATLTLGACFRASVGDRSPSIDEALLRLRFDNGGREHVHVYLIGEKRQWLLGRVEPGAVAILRMPEESLSGDATLMRLAVIAGQRITLQAARHPLARVTVPQPASAILSQQWKFAQGHITSLRR